MFDSLHIVDKLCRYSYNKRDRQQLQLLPIQEKYQVRGSVLLTLNSISDRTLNIKSNEPPDRRLFFMSKYYKLQADLIQSGLTPRAILLYAILADRAELSRKTGDAFKDKYGTYIIYPVKKLCEALNVGERTVKYALSELEDEGYIKTRKQGRTRPQKIYMCDRQNIAAHCTSDRQEIAPHCTSDRQEIAPHDRQKIAPHDRQEIAPHNNNTNNTSTNLSSSQRMIKLLELIDAISDEEHIALSQKQIEKIIKRIRKNAKDIINLRAYLKTMIQNESATPEPEPTDEYGPTYDIEEYEKTSVIDEEDPEDLVP